MVAREGSKWPRVLPLPAERSKRVDRFQTYTKISYDANEFVCFRLVTLSLQLWLDAVDVYVLGCVHTQVKFQEEYRARQQDKLRYRYPRGESYLDVITRLEVRACVRKREAIR